jgi:hypothetical protein
MNNIRFMHTVHWVSPYSRCTSSYWRIIAITSLCIGYEEHVWGIFNSSYPSLRYPNSKPKTAQHRHHCAEHRPLPVPHLLAPIWQWHYHSTHKPNPSPPTSTLNPQPTNLPLIPGIHTHPRPKTITYDHRQRKAPRPVRSAYDKPLTGGLVVKWVTIGESPLLYVFFAFFLSRGIWRTCLVVEKS